MGIKIDLIGTIGMNALLVETMTDKKNVSNFITLTKELDIEGKSYLIKRGHT